LWFRYYSTGSERKRTSQLVAGDSLQDGRFEVAGQIGGGGQGTAYVAVDKNADTASGAASDVVLKEYILPVHRGQSVLQATVQKLEQEAEILRKIDHKHIVKLLDSFVEDHRGYLVMEYVHGKQLKEIVAQQGPMPEATVIVLAKQICDVLSYLHSQDPAIIHRDLTPDNLILQDNGEVKLVDFNVAHQLESAATATVVGKHCYIPPEQFRGKPTPQSDVYAFGCTLHYLLTGLEPEPLTVSRPRAFNQNVTDDFNDIIARATALDAAKRFANVAEMHDAIQALSGVKIKISENVTA
jgi:serine/threonine-protein kinase